jgi:outer membrane protein TolC
MNGKTKWWIAAVAGCCSLLAQEPAPGTEAAPAQSESAAALAAMAPLTVVPARPRVGISTSTDLTLQDVVERVLTADPELEISRISLEKAGYSVKGAFGTFDPVLALNAYKSRSVTPVASAIGGSASGKLISRETTIKPTLSGTSPLFGSTYSLSFSDSKQISDSSFNTLNPQFPSSLTLDFTQPLLRNFRMDQARHAVQVARKNRQLSTEQLRQRVIERVTAGVQYYWELVYAWQNLSVQNEAVRLAVEQYQSNRRQAEQGVLAPIEVIAAQTQVATYQQAQAAAQQTLTEAENNLRQLITSSREDALWSSALVPTTQMDAATNLPDFQVAVKQALAARPEVASSTVNLAVNRADQTFYKSQALPQVNAYTTLTTQGLAGTQQALTGIFASMGATALPPILVGGNGRSLADLREGDFPSWKVGVQVSLPLRNRTAAANAATAAADGRRLEALRRETEMQVEADVRNALERANSARNRYDAARIARRSAEEQYSSERRQFSAGTSTMFLVFQRQTSFVSARSSEERARADLGEALANLDRATAQTIETHKIKLN